LVRRSILVAFTNGGENAPICSEITGTPAEENSPHARMAGLLRALPAAAGADDPDQSHLEHA
jgi:hypothetical protein